MDAIPPLDLVETARNTARKVLFEAGVDVGSENLLLATNEILIQLMEERERCARIVDNYKRDASFDDSMVGAQEHNSNESNIARAIRGE